MLTMSQFVHPRSCPEHRILSGVGSLPDLDQLDEEIARALESVLARYGHDLPRFFKDVQEKQTSPEGASQGEKFTLAKDLLQKIYARW